LQCGWELPPAVLTKDSAWIQALARRNGRRLHRTEDRNQWIFRLGGQHAQFCDRPVAESLSLFAGSLPASGLLRCKLGSARKWRSTRAKRAKDYPFDLQLAIRIAKIQIISIGSRGHSAKMRIHQSVLLLSTICSLSIASSAAVAQTDRTPSPISVHISTPKRTTTVRTTIHVEVRVANSGDAAMLVPNTVSTASGGTAYLEFELSDTKGHISPRINLIADNFMPVQPSDDNAAAKLLGSWTLLYPHTSLLFDIPIGEAFFKFLQKPGHYRLDATYASNGISYGRNSLGLSEKLLSSLPYPSWRGKVSTNNISLIVVSANATKK